MKSGAFPIWVYVAVALAIAVAAFGIGQLQKGMGVPFVVLATSVWMLWSAKRQREWFKKNG